MYESSGLDLAKAFEKEGAKLRFRKLIRPNTGSGRSLRGSAPKNNRKPRIKERAIEVAA